MQQGTNNRRRIPGRRSAWATARVTLLTYWDHPPAVLFWLAFTAGTIVILKGLGL